MNCFLYSGDITLQWQEYQEWNYSCPWFATDIFTFWDPAGICLVWLTLFMVCENVQLANNKPNHSKHLVRSELDAGWMTKSWLYDCDVEINYRLRAVSLPVSTILIRDKKKSRLPDFAELERLSTPYTSVQSPPAVLLRETGCQLLLFIHLGSGKYSTPLKWLVTSKILQKFQLGKNIISKQVA